MKTWDHRKLGNFKKIPEILGITSNSTQNKNFGNFAKKFQKKNNTFFNFLNILQKKIFYLILRIFLQYFVQGCGKSRTFANIYYLYDLKKFGGIHLVEKRIFQKHLYLKNCSAEEQYKENSLKHFAKFTGKHMLSRFF